MNAPPFMLRLLMLVASFSVTGIHAADSARVDVAEVRGAVTKSLGFLAREGDAWMNEHDCNACHHMPLLIWSHRQARQRGFAVDPQRYDEFVSWSKEHAQDARSGPEPAALLKLALPAEPSQTLTKLLAGLQEPGGSWKPGQQFVSMQRRSADEARANSARIVLLGLGVPSVDGTLVESARGRAAEFLGKSGAATMQSSETLAFRALYAGRFGDAQEVAVLCEEIFRHQHADGGWAWVIGEEKSDPLATGQTLYTLRHLADPAAVEAITRAERWLLDQQREDGSWSTDFTKISKLDRSAPEKRDSFKAATGIYTFWGSAWATIGLLEGLPVEAPGDE